MAAHGHRLRGPRRLWAQTPDPVLFTRGLSRDNDAPVCTLPAAIGQARLQLEAISSSRDKWAIKGREGCSISPSPPTLFDRPFEYNDRGRDRSPFTEQFR